MVTLDGAPSNSVALLKGYESFFGGELVDVAIPGQEDRGNLVTCFDTTVPAPDYFKAFVLFTPAHGR